MKLRCLVPAILLAAAWPAAAQPAPDPDLLPSGRTFIEVREAERNPFGQPSVAPTSTMPEEVESEEARLRRILSALKVAGVSKSGTDSRALVGTLILSKGRELPSLLRGQRERLVVTSVDAQSVVISFVEQDATAEPRRIILSVDVEPRVDQMLFGEAVEQVAGIGKDGSTALGKLPFPGVERALKGAEEAELQGLSSRKFELMGDTRHAEEPPVAE